MTWLSNCQWILSADVGRSYLEEDGSGVWIKTGITPETVGEVPDEIDALS